MRIFVNTGRVRRKANPLFWSVLLRADILDHREITCDTIVSYDFLSQHTHTLKKLHLLIELTMKMLGWTVAKPYLFAL